MRVPERGHDDLLMNSLKAAFVWGNAGIAQLVEQLICNQQVVGSNPTAGSFNLRLESLAVASHPLQAIALKPELTLAHVIANCPRKASSKIRLGPLRP